MEVSGNSSKRKARSKRLLGWSIVTALTLRNSVSMADLLSLHRVTGRFAFGMRRPEIL